MSPQVFRRPIVRLSCTCVLLCSWLAGAVPVASSAPSTPSVLGWEPALGRGVAPTSPLSIYFDRPMDHTSVQRAWQLTPAATGSFAWRGSRVTFRPAVAFRPGTYYRLSIGVAARSASGAALAAPFTAAFTTSDALKVQSITPAAGTQAVPPNGLIAVTFSQPMVPLAGVGARSSPPGWHASISPAVAGSGSWLGTSTWVFRPTSGFSPSTHYTVTIAAGVRDAWGQSLGRSTRWTFRTVTPEVVARTPSRGAQFANPRGPVSIRFNQPMSHRSAASAFSLRSSHGAVHGTISWKGNTLQFHPAGSLAAHLAYTVSVGAAARSANGRATLAKRVTWSFQAAPPPALVATSPARYRSTFDSQVTFRFNTPMDQHSLDTRLTISPGVSGLATSLWGPAGDHTFHYQIAAQFKPSTTYTISIGSGIRDRFGRSMSGALSLPFRTARIQPGLDLYGMPGGRQVISIAAGQIGKAPIQSINVPRIHYDLEKSNVHALAMVVSGNASYPESKVRRWSTAISSALNKVQDGDARLTTSAGKALAPGMYVLHASSDSNLPGMRPYGQNPAQTSELIVVQNVGVTIKQSGRGGLVWVTSAQTGQPWANAPVTLITDQGSTISSGRTDSSGLYAFHLKSDRGSVGALVQDATHFGVTSGYWTANAQPDEPGPLATPARYIGEYQPASDGTYAYTDRPIYRPGQRVHFRAVIWRDKDAIYSHYGAISVTAQISGPTGRTIYTRRFKLDRFGAVTGTASLPANASTGGYNLYVSGKSLPGTGTTFSVAEYRKPEFLTTVTADRPSYAQGDAAVATVHVDYVFGAPVAQQHVTWAAYAQPLLLEPPGWDAYTFLDWETYWEQYQKEVTAGGALGVQIAGGQGKTDANGTLTVRLPINLAKYVLDQTVTLEATTTDINGQSVSGRVQFPAYKAGVAIGLAPEHRIVPVGQPETVDVAAVLPDGSPLAGRQLNVQIFRRTYTSQLTNAGNGVATWQSVPHDTVITSQTILSGSDGKAAVVFTPSAGGDYYVTVSARDSSGNLRKNAVTISASAAGDSDWGSVESTQVPITPDKTLYRVGDTAHLVVQAPFDHATALITEERGTIRSKKVVSLASNAPTIDVPITMSDIPNIYVTVSLYRGWRNGSPPDWRYGVADLHVSLAPRSLTVHITRDAATHRPGDKATYTITTSDSAGNPVSAQVSLALVDTSVLALQQEVNADILSALYGVRGLGVSTASDGTVSIDHLQVQPNFLLAPIIYGIGGGGGGGAYAGPSFGANLPVQAAPKTGGGGVTPPGLTVRSHFADTAYWTGALLTNASGTATVRLTLPDNTTTWRMDARAIAADEKVGGATTKTLVTQDIIVRPALPRFFLEGDSLKVGTVVNNNLGRAVPLTVSLHATGISISGSSSQAVSVPAHGEKLLLWPANVPVSTSATLTFAAQPADSGIRGDAVAMSVPVHPPLTDETTATSGQVFDAGRQYVVVPGNAVARPGALTIRVSSALTAGLGASYSQFKPQPVESNEQIADRLLVTASLRALPYPLTGLSRKQYAGLRATVSATAGELIGNQLGDGGWPWFNDGWYVQSDPTITATAVEALAQAGWGTGPSGALQRGRMYLRNALARSQPATRSDLMVALVRSGGVGRGPVEALYHDSIHRSHLDIAPLAELGRSLASVRDPAAARSVVAMIDARAVASATGAHWESAASSFWSRSAIETTVDVLDSLLTTAPRDPFVPAAVRWLMLSREGAGWDCGPTTAQAIAVLARYARAAGEGRAAYAYRVLVGRSQRLSGQYSGSSSRFSAVVSVPVSTLGRKPVSVTLLRQSRGGVLGKGPFYYVADLHYYVRARSIGALNRGISVQRRYTDLSGRAVTSAPAGSAVQVHLTIRSDGTLTYLDVEDPLPSGLEPIDESLQTSQQGIASGRPWWSYTTANLGWYLNHTDIHDDRVSLYASYLPPGTYTYTYLATATVPGSFAAAPTHAAETFFPEVFGRSAGAAFNVS